MQFQLDILKLTLSRFFSIKKCKQKVINRSRQSGKMFVSKTGVEAILYRVKHAREGFTIKVN